MADDDKKDVMGDLAAQDAYDFSPVDVPIPTPRPNLLEQARQEYPVLNNYDIGYKESPGKGQGYMESFPPGEPGSPQNPRPSEFPLQQFGVENYRPDSKASDVMADITSHHLVNVDPTVKQTYQGFAASLQPFQHDILVQQYQHAVQNEGETRPFEQWRDAAGLPGMFRGYAFDQWPKEFTDQAYTPQQKQQLNDMVKYLKGTRSDLSPDETQMQPPQNAVGGLTPEDWMMSGQQPPAATYDYVPPQSWLQKAGDLARRDVATYQQGGVPAMMGQLAEDSSGEQDLAGGFGGNIKGVGGKIGALADLAPHAPPFYSAVEQAVQGAKQTTAPGQQWAGFLRNQPGVKPEELNTLKLGDLFDQTAVTKQDLLDHIAANKVQLGEVVRGDNTQQQMNLAQEVIKEKAQLQRLGNEWDAALPEARSQITDEMNLRHDRIRELENQSAGLPERNSKFDQYTLPGGENYRETLLTLPTQDAAKSARMTELEQKLRNPADYDAPELNSMRQEYKQLADETRDSGTFKSSHFDEPNILAHIRTNDRVIDGKKTLFVEEVQSDWHQKGKRSGYDVPDNNTLTDLPEGYRVSENSALRGELPTYSVYGPDGEQIIGNRPNRQGAINEVVNELNGQRRAERGLSGSPVPDAPFKTTWPDLAMKRVIREAAEKGYDKVAWTPGSVQADRYDLSKQVSKINAYRVQNAGEPVLKDGQPQYRVQAHDKDGRLALDQYVVERDLPDTIGKDLADKIIKARDGAHDYSGLDLKIGGEGMKGFYDQILPAAVNKIVKKAGGRVGQGEIQGSGPDLIEEGRGNYRKPRPDETDTYKVHTLDITPQLREMALKKGFPLFTAGGLVAGGAISGSKMGDLAKQDDYQ